MNIGIAVLAAVAFLLACVAALFVYSVRVLLRVIALRAAVAFLQTPGTSGDVVILAAGMFRFLATSRTRS